jgi:hypothetical protein
MPVTTAIQCFEWRYVRTDRYQDGAPEAIELLTRRVNLPTSMKAQLAVLLGFFSVALTAQPPEATHRLDIVGYRLTPEFSPPAISRAPASGLEETITVTLYGPSPRGSRNSHSPPPKVQAKATLVGIDRLSYETGDPIVYEVLFENIGNEPITLPWSPDRARFKTSSLSDPAAPLATHSASLGLEVRTRDGARLGWLELQSLLGSSEVPDSLEILAPGEVAWIRVPGVWRATATETEKMLSQPDGLVHVGVMVHLENEGVIVHSANSVEVLLQSRLRRLG